MSDKVWKGDVTKAPGLSKKELKSYDNRCDVAFSTKAWMGKQVCEYDVQRILDAIGDENILLQLDGYESYLNALKKLTSMDTFERSFPQKIALIFARL